MTELDFSHEAMRTEAAPARPTCPDCGNKLGRTWYCPTCNDARLERAAMVKAAIERGVR